MMRSILLSVEVKTTSYTRLTDDLKENQLHANLSVFTVGDTPGTGTFYDLLIFQSSSDQWALVGKLKWIFLQNRNIHQDSESLFLFVSCYSIWVFLLRSFQYSTTE